MIALTGYDRQFDKQASFDAGFELHVVKPASMLKLVELLDISKTNALV